MHSTLSSRCCPVRIYFIFVLSRIVIRPNVRFFFLGVELVPEATSL